MRQTVNSYHTQSPAPQDDIMVENQTLAGIKSGRAGRHQFLNSDAQIPKNKQAPNINHE
jgi:hypothetical protein